MEAMTSKDGDKVKHVKGHSEEHHKVTSQGKSRQPMKDSDASVFVLTQLPPPIPRGVKSGTLS